MDWNSGFIYLMVESDKKYNVQQPAQTEESCRNKVTALKISNNRNKVFNYATSTLLRESQPLEWKKCNAEDSRCLAACTSSSRWSSWRWNFAHWRSQWVPRKSTCKKVFSLHLSKTIYVHANNQYMTHEWLHWMHHLSQMSPADHMA